MGEVMNIIEWRDRLLETELSYRAKLTGLVLSQFYRNKTPTYPAVRTISQLAGLTINPVQDGIKELVASGLLERQQKRMKGNKFLSNIYTFIGVTETKHVSLPDTSNDTSNDTSSGDTEVDEVDKKKESDNFIFLKWNGIRIKNGGSIAINKEELEYLKKYKEEGSVALIEWKNNLKQG
jgi:hypothetical protein